MEWFIQSIKDNFFIWFAIVIALGYLLGYLLEKLRGKP